jgi:predicted PurR-regulated permease PerM
MSYEQKKLTSLRTKVYRLILVLLSILLAYVVLKIATPVKEIVFAFFISILINYLLAKPVAFLSKFIKVRAIVVLILFVAIVYLLAIFTYYMIPNIAVQFKALKIALPALVDNFFNALKSLDAFLNTNYNLDLSLEKYNKQEIVQSLGDFFTKINIAAFGDTAWNVLTSSFSALLYFILSLILSFYLLIDGDNAWELFLVPFSVKVQIHLKAIKERIDSSLYAFVLGQFQIAFLTSSVMLVTYLIMNVPYALILGLLQMLEIVPVVGTWTAIIPSLIIVGLTVGWSKALVALIVYLIYTQFARDNFIAPRIMGTALGFHPIGIILAIIIGAKVGGPIGVVFALPILAVINSTVTYNIELSRLKINKTMDYRVG